ncbi:MAG: J domain-containing protein, partial [Solirubrobacteraceae bacterium]
MPAPPDPYRTLGVTPSASDAQVRASYRRLVQLHHPDHNGGSPESAARFELVQWAYAEVRARRAGAVAAPGAGAGAGHADVDPDLEERLAAMERDVVARRDASERALREARRAADA